MVFEHTLHLYLCIILSYYLYYYSTIYFHAPSSHEVVCLCVFLGDIIEGERYVYMMEGRRNIIMMCVYLGVMHDTTHVCAGMMEGRGIFVCVLGRILWKERRYDGRR